LASIITLSFFLNNCNSEKRFGFREKVRVYHNSNSAKVFQKNPTKSLDVLTISNEKNIAPKLKEGTIILKNAKHSIPFELLTASIDTPKPYEIKKLPVVEEEQKTTVSVSKPEHKGISGGYKFAIVLLVIGVILILVGVLITPVKHDWNSGGEGCAPIFIGGVFIVFAILVAKITMVIHMLN